MLGLWTRFFFINPKQSQACNFSLCCYYLIKQKILQNNEKDHNGWNSLMIEQILPTYTTRQNWSSLRRIFILLPRLKKVIVVCELCPFWSSQKYGEQEGIFLGTSRGKSTSSPGSSRYSKGGPFRRFESREDPEGEVEGNYARSVFNAKTNRKTEKIVPSKHDWRSGTLTQNSPETSP